MARKKTKLEEALYRIHLDINGDKEVALEEAIYAVRQLTSLIIGQKEIENHDVDLVVQILVKERNKLRDEQNKRKDKYMGKDSK